MNRGVVVVILAVLIGLPISIVGIGWLLSHTWGYYVAVAVLSVISFIIWRRRTERMSGSEYIETNDRIKWLQEKGNPFKRR